MILSFITFALATCSRVALQDEDHKERVADILKRFEETLTDEMNNGLVTQFRVVYSGNNDSPKPTPFDYLKVVLAEKFGLEGDDVTVKSVIMTDMSQNGRVATYVVVWDSYFKGTKTDVWGPYDLQNPGEPIVTHFQVIIGPIGSTTFEKGAKAAIAIEYGLSEDEILFWAVHKVYKSMVKEDGTRNGGYTVVWSASTSPAARSEKTLEVYDVMDF